MPSFAERLDDRGVLLADGATGTNFQDMGIEPGVAPEEWVLSLIHISEPTTPY